MSLPQSALSAEPPGTAPKAENAVVAGPAAATSVAQAGGGVRRSSTGKGWRRLVSPIVFLALWQVVSVTGVVSAQKLPPLTTLWTTGVHLVTTNSPAYGTLQGAMLVSLGRVASGFAIGGAAGVLLAMIAGLSRLGELSVDPLMQMLRTLPLFGLIPVFIVWFGIGEEPKLVLIALAAAIPLYINTFAGIRSVDAKLAEVGRILGLRGTRLVRHIVFPGALPQILVGLRLSLAAAWLALVVAEQINASGGLGYMINQGESFQAQNIIFVALFVYLVLGMLTDAVVRLIERRALAWRRGLMDS